MLIIELDVFSGRSNPCWELDESRALALRQLEERLEPVDRPRVQPPGLGYRGFLYAGVAGRVRAYGGWIDARQQALADPLFTVERYLLDQIPPAFASLRERVAAELARLK